MDWLEQEINKFEKKIPEKKKSEKAVDRVKEREIEEKERQKREEYRLKYNDNLENVVYPLLEDVRKKMIEHKFFCETFPVVDEDKYTGELTWKRLTLKLLPEKSEKVILRAKKKSITDRTVNTTLEFRKTHALDFFPVGDQGKISVATHFINHGNVRSKYSHSNEYHIEKFTKAVVEKEIKDFIGTVFS